ncbi:MAG: methyltransferase family protein [Bacteriovoracales bacterium]
MNINPDSPKIIFPPPLIFLIFVLIGYFINGYYPLPLFQNPIKLILTLIFFFTGLFLGAYSFWLFKKNKTDPLPWMPTTKIIITGPYKYSRNPMYLSIVLIGFSISIFLSNGWIFLMMFPFLTVIDLYVVKREEKYLIKKFGQEYLDYQKKVRRWI